MFQDNQPCRVCGAPVALEAADGEPPRPGADPDGPVDHRVCSNPECASHDEESSARA